MDNTYTLRARSVMRPVVLLPALVVGLSLSFTGAASAQTAVPFQANVNYITPIGPPSARTWPCPNPYYCGNASIAGYGAAFWSFDSPNPNPTPVSPDCARYIGTSTFTLGDGSQLVLNEDAIGCHPGNSGNTPGWRYAVGHPGRITGSWTVQTGTGRFSGLRGGSGTDTLRTNGALLEATWSGTVTFQ